MGPVDVWAIAFSCGLEVTLASFQIDDTGAMVPHGSRGVVEVHSSDLDLNHLRAHSPIPLNDLSFWETGVSGSRPRAWWLVRQDDHGNTFDVEAFSTSCEAEATARSFEARGHKQTYWVVHRP
jgi:hypothetical protein